MGKTHFWRRPTELPSAQFAAAANEIRRVVGLAAMYRILKRYGVDLRLWK